MRQIEYDRNWGTARFRVLGGNLLVLDEQAKQLISAPLRGAILLSFRRRKGGILRLETSLASRFSME